MLSVDENRRLTETSKGTSRGEFDKSPNRVGHGLRRPHDYFGFYASQPEQVRKAYEEAIGI